MPASQSLTGLGNPIDNNLARWRDGNYVAEYATDELEPAERRILSGYREELHGRVLELGCGAGRVTGHLLQIATEVYGLDISPRMLDECRRRYPHAIYREGDMRDLSAYGDRLFDAVLAPCNILDALDHQDRLRTLDEIHRVLREGGLLVMSAHNRAYVPRLRRPTWVLSRWPKRAVEKVIFFPRRMRNHLRLRRLERSEEEYAIVNDDSHEYSLLHYYITPQAQTRQLADHGFELLTALDIDCDEVGPQDTAERHVRVHYVARCRAVAN